MVQQLNVSSYLSVASEVNQNITAAQKELLKWHWRVGHAGFQWIQWLMATPRSRLDASDEPILKVKIHKASSCTLPLCVACQIAKQARQGAETIKQTKVIEKEKMLRREHFEPGQMVSVDQYVSALPGRLPHTKGKEARKDKYCRGPSLLTMFHSRCLLRIKCR
jgi:hypothetical protein